MAQFLLASIIIEVPSDEAYFSAGDSVKLYYDDSVQGIAVYLNDVAFSEFDANLGAQGANYNFTDGITSTEGGYAIAGYSFCSGSDLIWFRMLTHYPQYPFMEIMTTVDSPVCDVGGGAVCDIGFVGAFTITHSTDKSTGGSVAFQAQSSNGTIKYSLHRDFDYATGGTEMTAGVNTITGIVPGTWTLYIKDANDCTAVRTFKVLYKPTDVEHYRFTWASVKIQSGTSRDARVRIYEREYVGDLVEVDYGDTAPFLLSKPKQGSLNDKFYPVHPTNATLVLKSLHDYQFLPLFTQDNKKYRVVYEVDEGSGFTPVWQGFIVPSVYRENFVAAPYSVEIQIGDNVKTLEEEPFTDEDGNILFGDLKIIKVIALIMKKTGLSLNIRSGINIFEENHNTAATDDPLDQTYVDVTCYRDDDGAFSCWEVLESILRPFGARIYQYDNSWIIEEIDRAVSEYAYRVFDSNGDYVSNSTFDPVVEVKAPTYSNRAALVDRDHSLEVIPAYGKIDITSRLNYIGSIVAGGFEKEDLLSPESETFSQALGVYTSEEGFRDWTLRLNGTQGVSFGRVEVSRRGDSSRTGLATGDDDGNLSVGAFFYNPESWSGNLRNAYVESAAKPYQYGPGDEIKFRFDYSTPAKPEYEFMVLRMVIKIGDNYLQPDRTWDTTEAIYRAYPKVSNSLQTFELSVPAPSTTVVVDTTIQVRIYYYASAFYDYGLPPATSSPSGGTDGINDLKDFVTDGLDIDYRVDVRHQFTIGSTNGYFREFYELRYSDTAENVLGGIVHPDDHDSSTNAKIWSRIKAVNEASTSNIRGRGVDLKFYLDNVTLDALINGQPPAQEETISLSISKYINENLPIELYNFDVPNITNAKNMYNNYFRLSDGTPTTKWARSGISESLPIQQILLKVFGANHSAPTFRMTGSFVNEFSRIGINNYIKITKPGSSLSANNTEFSTDLSGWTQVTLPLDGSWTWTADNSGSAQCTLTGNGSDSKRLYQNITHAGGYIEFTVNIKATPTAGNTREDVLWVLFYRSGQIVHTEKMRIFAGVTSEADYNFTYIAFAPGSVDRIGFYIKNSSGSGTCNYKVGKFAPAGKDITEVYQIADYQQDELGNRYFFELMQLNKTYISLGNIDTGGNNQSGGDTGSSFSGGYSSGYGGGFDTVLN